ETLTEAGEPREETVEAARQEDQATAAADPATRGDVPTAAAGTTDPDAPADDAGDADSDDPGYYVDLMADEIALARSQIASGLSAVAEAVLVRRVARLQSQGSAAFDELDVARGLLTEALWRQGRPVAAGAVAGRVRASSLERRRPLVMVIEAESLAATGQQEAATRLMRRIVDEVGVDEAWRLRGGVPSRLPWPLPPSLRARRPAEVAAARRGMEAASAPASVDPERTAGAHAHLEAARLA
ncbi:MAG: hypothetical protein ACXWNG_07200, partial [Candidatus Limnocylindrales bacterium]